MILGFLEPPRARRQRLCDFNRGRSLVVKSRLKSLASPDRPNPDRKNYFLEITFSRSHSDIAGFARLLRLDFTTRDRPLLKSHSVCRLALGGSRNPKIIKRLLTFSWDYPYPRCFRCSARIWFSF